MKTKTKIECIANNGTNGETEVPFYDCPCKVCTKMEWEALMSDSGNKLITLKAHRFEAFPESWDAAGKPVVR
jgi:hypothetical protein